MPIYEFACKTCGHRFDFLAKRVSMSPEVCPECGSRELRKQVSVFSAGVRSGGGDASDGRPSCPAGTCCPGGSCSLG